MRTAVKEDLPRLVEMCAAMHAESRYARFEISLRKVEAFLCALLESRDAITLVDGEPLCAMFLGYVQPFWWGEALSSSDFLLYVMPGKRNGRYAMRLVNAYVKEAHSRGAQFVTLGESAGITTEQTEKFFTHMGFDPVSTGYAYAQRRQKCAA